MYFGTLAVGLGCFPLDNGPYHPLSHCQVCSHEIRSLIIFSTPRWGHHIFSALPSCHSYPDACPKAISGRTSYLRVRLEFLLPTIHPLPFQRESVRSSIKFYLNFNLIMARSLGFGSINTDSRPLKTRFRFGSDSSS